MKPLEDPLPGDSLSTGLALAYLWYHTGGSWWVFGGLVLLGCAVNAWKLWRINR